ncbi:flavodoxin domain-containing protein [Alkalicoccus chagannorensis]|uniref:flavodoxin domain-containing protein n=1 Tax=Alkalicoccus chagannorensis TaxID=427072 RepID=UPI00042395D7|nr:flavodoxin domain-containing protein [Alkalicoccus chagannorensis]
MIIVSFASSTGNTAKAASWIVSQLEEPHVIIPPEQLTAADLNRAAALLAGTYTWGNGEIPDAAMPLAELASSRTFPELVTGIFGTGDQGFPFFCGAVDRLAGIFQQTTRLAVTLKMEQAPQPGDWERCRLFVKKVQARRQQTSGARHL